ncbi:hypothetical protein N7523_005537 [Penicillium sp. IBT 18751x]|nr:hypothetical protein N7523_005877 [Penicillium sp. IBT 18751x]KAJ6117786.1 hypothetical protein N7523_005537 [Penicillium sp. IBT 18751x]
MTNVADQNEENLQPDHQCWRWEEIKELLRREDQDSKRRLCKFGLLTDQYAQATGLPGFPSFEEPYSPISEIWGLNPEIFDECPSAVASKLSERSQIHLKSIPFKEFVQKAWYGSSKPFTAFAWKHRILHLKLYNLLMESPEHEKKFLQIIESLEGGQSDLFIIGTVKHTWQMLLRTERFQSDMLTILSERLHSSLGRVIIDPLKQLLGGPSTARQILQHLEVLENDFRDNDRVFDVNWGTYRHVYRGASNRISSGLQCEEGGAQRQFEVDATDEADMAKEKAEDKLG